MQDEDYCLRQDDHTICRLMTQQVTCGNNAFGGDQNPDQEGAINITRWYGQEMDGNMPYWPYSSPTCDNLIKPNGLQFLFVATMLRLCHRTGEPWHDFQRQRYGRHGKAALFCLSIPRWSTLLLKHIWKLRGTLFQANGHTHLHRQCSYAIIPALRKWEEGLTMRTTDWHPTKINGAFTNICKFFL